VKAELDKESGAIVVESRLFTPMAYPAGYGCMPRTLNDEGDAIIVKQLGRLR
jgi:inorganic pyrophosphatase